LPGLFFASVMNSCIVRAGTCALTAAMMAPRDTRLIGAKALRGSYAKSRYNAGAIATVLVLP
jgi:hypothetical protein